MDKALRYDRRIIRVRIFDAAPMLNTEVWPSAFKAAVLKTVVPLVPWVRILPLPPEE